MRRFLPDTRGLPRAFWFLWAGTFVNRLGGFVAPFLAIYLTSVRGLSVQRAGLVVSLVGLGAIASGPVGGTLADRLGRRPTLALATLLGGGGMLALGFVRSAALIAPTALFLGFANDLYRPTVAAIVADVVPQEDRARAYGLLYWVVNLGFSISLFAAGFLANRSFMLLFVGDAATTFLFGAIVFVNVPETRPPHDARERARSGGYLAPYGDGLFVAFAALSMIVAIIFFQAHMTLPVDMRGHGVSNAQFGALMALNGVLIVLLQPFMGPFVQRFPWGRVLAAAALLTGFGFALSGLTGGSIAVYALSVTIWTMGEIVMAPATPAVIADFSPASLRGAYQGAFQLAWGGAAFLAPTLGSYLLGRFGPATLWTACAIAGVVSATGFVMVVRRT
jgi:MFS family permease